MKGASAVQNEAKVKLLKYDGIWQNRNEHSCMHTNERNVFNSWGFSNAHINQMFTKTMENLQP
jgi:hypothetical protein